MGEFTGLGTTFERGEDPGTGVVYTAIAQIAEVAPPQPERELVEVEELNPPGQVRKKLVGLIDAGEVTLTLNFDPTNTGHMDLEGDFQAGVAVPYRIKLPNDYGWTFNAICTAYQPQSITAGGVVQVQVTLALTGVYEFGQITA